MTNPKDKALSHVSPLHIVADSLMDHFKGSDATNYIEQTFVDKSDSSRSFVLTMQMKDGSTPCEKLFSSNERIKELEQAAIDVFNDFCCVEIMSMSPAVIKVWDFGQELSINKLREQAK